MSNLLTVLRSDPSSEYYNAYSQPTSTAVKNLTALGFNTSLLNDDFFGSQEYQSFMAANLEHSDTTGGVKSPSKKSTRENQIAYYLDKAYGDYETTKKAKEEYNAAMNEAMYLAGNPGWNYSDEKILETVKQDFDKKYPTLAKMQSSGATPVALTEAVDFSEDALLGAMWAARNPEYHGGLEGAMANSYLGKGNVWQEDEKVTSLLNPEDPNYNPFATGSTNMLKAGMTLGQYSFEEGYVQNNQDKYYNGTEAEKEAILWVDKGEQNQQAVDTATTALYGYVNSLLSSGETDSGKVQEAIDTALAGKKLYTYTNKNGEEIYTTKKPSVKNYEEVDLSILNEIDKQCGKTVNGVRSLPVTDPDELLPMTRGTSYKYDSLIPQVTDLCAQNAEILSEADTVNDIMGYGQGPINPEIAETEPYKPETTTGQEVSPEEIAGQSVQTGTQTGMPETEPKAAGVPAGKTLSSPTDLGPLTIITEADKKQMEEGNKKIREAADTVENVASENEATVMKYAGTISFNPIKNYLTAMRMNPGVMQGIVDKDINKASKAAMDSGLKSAHDMAAYETLKLQNDANVARFNELQAKYGNVEDYNKDIQTGLVKQIGDYTVTLTLDDSDPEKLRYIVSDISSPTMNADYGMIMDQARMEQEDGVSGWASQLIAEAEAQCEPEAKEANRIAAVQTKISALGEEGAAEINEYKTLNAQIAKENQKLAQDRETYEQAQAELKKNTSKLNMMAETAFILGADSSRVVDAYDFLRDMLNYHDEPQLPMQGATKLEQILSYGEYMGNDYTTAQASEILHQQMENVDERIRQIDQDIAYADKIGYQIPGDYARNIQLKREDLVNEKRALEYSAILTDVDSNEFDNAVNAAKAFEEKYGESSMNYWANLFSSDDFRTLLYNDRYTMDTGDGREAYNTITDEEKDIYYYLLGKKILEMGDSLDEALKNINTNEQGAQAALREAFSEAAEYERFMEDDQSGYGVWNNREYDQSVEYGRELVESGPLGGTLANIGATMVTPGESIAAALYTFDRLITGGRFSEKSLANRLTGFKNETREATRESINEYYQDNPVMKFIANIGYEIYCNRGDSAMNALTFGMLFPEVSNPILNELLGASPMGVTAGLNAAIQAVENGANTNQAWLILGTTFMAETMTEALTRSNIMEALGDTRELNTETLKQFFKEWLTGSGVEEMFGESANDLIENYFNRGAAEWFDNPNFESDHQKLIDKYYAEGYTGEGEAEAKAYEEELKGIAHTAFVSYLSAGADVMTKVGRTALNTVKTAADVVNSYRGYTKAQQKMGYGESMLDYMARDLKNRNKTNTPASAQETGAAAAKQLTADQVRAAGDVATLQRVEGSTPVTQTEALASILDNGNGGDAVSEQANAAATFLMRIMGKDANDTVQQVMNGVSKTDVSRDVVTAALQNAALGNGTATALVKSEAFKNASNEQKARMLAETVQQDQASAAVHQNIMATVKDYRRAVGINELAANGHFDQANADRAAANAATKDVAKAQTALDEKEQALEQAVEDAQQKADAVASDPSDINKKEHQDAVTNVNAADESRKQYEQHLANEQEKKDTADAKAQKSAEDAMTTAREVAEQKIVQEDQQRADQAAQEAEQQRQAEEAARQAQAEEDERTGKAEEDRDNAAIEQIVAGENLEGTEAENRKDQLKEQAEKVKIKLRDLKKPVSGTEGMLALYAFERKLGIKINLEDMGEITEKGWTRGKYSYNKDTGEVSITVNKNMTLGQALVEAALHEITHSMKNTEAYKTYRDVVLKSVFKESGDINTLYENNDDFRAKVDWTIEERKAAGDKNFVGKTHEEQIAAAEDEIVADFARLNLADKDVVQRFMDAGMGGRMRNTLHNINQALKNYFSNMTGEERKQAEYFRRAERAFQKAMDEVSRKSEHPEGEQFSIMQIAQATGMTFNENTLQLFDKDGNEIDGVTRQITPDMIADTPVGMLIRNGLSDQSPGVDENGNQIDSPQVAASKMMAGLMNMVARYKDSNLVWEIGATTLSSTFSALKSNSDPQYKTTVDFGTVCAKTQAIIDTLSQVMLDRVKEGKYGGLSREDIMKVYDAVNQAGLSVPCPVCYVFSRWMGVPSLLGQMSQYQHDYVVTNEDGSINKKATQEIVDSYIKTAEEKYGNAKAINNQKTKIQNKLVSLEEKRIALEKELRGLKTDEEKTAKQKEIDSVLAQMTDLDNQLGEVNAYNWITQALCKKNKNGKYVVDDKFQITPDEILFDLNRTGDFAGYEKNWRYRNTRGAGMGKAIMPYSGETIGDVLYGVKKGGRQSSIRNPWLNMDDKSAAKQLRDARARAIKQNLVGGQRLQSTSDFRPEWGLDYIMSFLELQAAGSKVQMYTKVAEAVDFFASVGADVNLSIMGKGQGWHVDENGNYVLDFSSVTGMDYETAKELKDKYNNVQMILVGMNDTHIRLAMANSDIDFIIPWHSSGNSKDVLAGLISAVGEKLDSSVDYSDTQTDKVSDTQTAEQKALWDARMKLLTKGGKTLTEAERKTLLSNPITADLYKRFTQKGVDDDCYGVKLSKEQANQIFPYEYWDTSLAKDQADQNGKRFAEYCEAMGIVPRFSQFKDDTGYWKLLIDRPMYNNDGSYHQQQVIDVTNARIGDLNEAGQLENSDLPTQAQAKYAPKDPRNENYEKYTAAQKQAVETAEAMINNRYDDGSEGSYSVYGEMSDTDNVMFEYMKSFDQQIDDFMNQDIDNNKIFGRDSLLVGKAPEVFTSIGLPSLPVTINQEHIGYSLNGNYPNEQYREGHIFPPDELKKLPEKIANPVAIAYDPQSSKELIIYVDMQNTTGDQVIVPMRIGGISNIGNNRINALKLDTVFANQNGRNMLESAIRNNSENNATLFYIDKEKASESGLRDDIITIVRGLDSGLIHNITDPSSSVKIDVQNQTDSIQFKRWFNGSKVANEDGTPLIVYHGTSEDFTAFDMSKGRSTMDIQGAFFSPWEEESAGYGENVGAYYLSIKRPASASEAYNALNRYKGQNEAGKKAKEYLISKGYDGVIDETDGQIYEIIAFYPEQIKSATENVGLFDKNNPDYRYSMDGERSAADEAMLNETLKKAGVLTQEETDAYQQMQTQLLLEGQNPTMSTGQGPAIRAFAAEDGMLKNSDELDRFAKAVVTAQNTYFPDTNLEQVQRAVKWIRSLRSTPNSDGFAEAYQAIVSPSFDYRSADGQARMVAVMGMAAAKNDVVAQTAMADAFMRQGTDLGRALQARKLFKLMTPEGRQSTLMQMLQNAKDEMGKKGVKVDLKFSDWVMQAAAFAETEEDMAKARNAAIAELAEQLPASWKDRLNSIRMLAMLGNPRTHIRNIIGNAMFIPAVSLKNKLGALMELGVKKGNKTKTLAPAVSKEIRDFAREDADNIKGLLTGEAKYNEAARIKQQQAPLGQFMKTLSDLNSNFLEGEDWFFLKGHYRRALGGWMQANGYTVEQVKNDKSLLEKGRQYAISEAQKATYRDFSKTAQMLNTISRNGGPVGFVMDAALPFKKTPINIMRRGIEYSPVGIAKALTYDMYRMKQYMDYQNGKLDTLPEKALSPTQVIDHICGGLSGTLVMALGYLLAGAGAATCGLDDDEDKFEKAKGNQEYALNPGKAVNSLLGFKLFGEDVTFTLDWAAPLSMPFFVGAAIREQLDSEGDVSIDDVLNAVGSMTEPVFNLSMLDGVNTLLKTSSYDNTNPITQIGAKIATNYLSSYVPSLLGAIARTSMFSELLGGYDGARRKSFVPADQSKGIMGNARYAHENAQNKIPFYNQQNIPVRDIWGNKDVDGLAERLLENFILPGYVKQYKEDPIINEMARLYEATGDTKMIPEEDPAKTITYTVKSTKEKVKHVLTDKEWDRYKEVRGQTAFKELTALMENEDYRNATDAVQVQMIKDVWSHADKVGQQAVIPDIDADESNDATVTTIAKDAKITGYKSEMIKALNTGDHEAYDAMVQALYDEGLEESDIRAKIRDYYRDQYKDAYRKNNDARTLEIEEILDEDNTGMDFSELIQNWQESVDNEGEEKEETKPKTNKPLMTLNSPTGRQADGFIASTGMSDVGSGRSTMPKRPASDADWGQYMDGLDDYWAGYDFSGNDPIGQYGQGNIDLNNRQIAQNDDGSISTERSFSFYDERTGKEVLIPLVADGRVLTEEEAIDRYYETGEYLGMFDDWHDADEYAMMLHNRQDWFYNR